MTMRNNALFYFSGTFLEYDDFIIMLEKEESMKSWVETHMSEDDYNWVDCNGRFMPKFSPAESGGVRFTHEYDLIACKLALGL